MQIMEIIKNRRSVRRYSEKPVEHEKILQILEAARLAPSWRNQQCWKFIVITDPEIKKNVVRCTSPYNQSWLGKETVIIIACGNPEASGFRNNQNYYLVDVAIATEHLILAATELGLGTCWIGAFDEDKMKSYLQIPNHFRIVMITPLGYPTDRDGFVGTITKTVVRSKSRKAMAEIACFNRWE